MSSNWLAGLSFNWRATLPVVMQAEVSECGLACLSMLTSYYGARADVASLRSRFRVSHNGTTLSQLVEYAEKLNLVARPLRLELEELGDLRVPCILHWDLGHFVVLRRVEKNYITIHDPALGARRISRAAADKLFSGFAIEVTPAAAFQRGDSRRRISVAELVGKVNGLWNCFRLVIVMALCLEALALLTPLLNQWVMDEALVAADHNLLNLLVVGYLMVVIVQNGIELGRSWSLLFLATHLNLQWSASVLSHLLRLPMAWFEKRHLGDVLSRFASVGAIQRVLTTGFISTVLDGLMAIGTFAMMFFYSGLLAAVVCGAVVAYAVLRVATYRPLREASQEELALSAKAQSCLLETVRAAQAVKLFGREMERRNRWLNLTVDATNGSVRLQRLQLTANTINGCVAGLARTLVLWIGANLAMNSAFTVGMLFAFTSYSAQFVNRMASLIDNLIGFRMVSVHLERLADIVMEAREDKELTLSHRVEQLLPRIELVDVGFRYGDAEPWVLRNVNLVIEPGEALAVIGPSGGGKTTLIKLILGTLNPVEGEILYGGVPLERLGMVNYRRVLGAVMQDDQLLAGSLADNISFFDQPIQREHIEHCARAAAIHDDICSMPMGYETFTGDMGTSLSGGQKQRILLARALYKKPRVLVLDEATSHLDPVLERQVSSAVAELDLTRIIVAHRRETVASASRVVMLSSGGIVDLSSLGKHVRLEPTDAQLL